MPDSSSESALLYGVVVERGVPVHELEDLVLLLFLPLLLALEAMQRLVD